MEGVPYAVIRQRIKDEFCIEVKSFDTLSRFWNENAAAALVAKRQRAVSLADEIAGEAAKTPGRFDQATIDALRQKAFELAVQPGSDPRDVKALYMLVLKSRDQELDEKALAFDQEKFREGLKTSIERAIDALYAECKGNAAALQAWTQLRAAVLSEVSKAA